MNENTSDLVRYSLCRRDLTDEVVDLMLASSQNIPLRLSGAIVTIAAGFCIGVFISLITDLSWAWTFSAVSAFCFVVFAIASGYLRRSLEALLILSLAFHMCVHIGGPVEYGYRVVRFPVTLTAVVLLGLYLIWGMRVMRREASLVHFFPSVTIPLMIIAAYSGVSSFFAEYPTYAFSDFPRMLENCFLFFYAANHVRSKADVHFVVCSLAISVALCGVVGFAQYFMGSSLGLVFLGTAQQQEELRYSTINLARVSGFLEHPNNLAWFLISCLPLLFVWVIGGLGSRSLRAICRVTFVLGSLTLVVTYSRAGWIGFFLSVLCIGLYLGYKSFLLRSTNRYFARYIIVCLIGIVLSLPLASGIVARVVEFDKGAAYARIPKMRSALEVIRYNWIRGVGMGNYAHIVQKYDPKADLDRAGGVPMPVHNICLHILAELGIATLALFAWVTLVCLRQARRCLRSVDGIVECFALGLLGGLAAFLVEGMTQPGTLQDPTFRSWWFLSGLFMGLGLLHKKTGPDGRYPEDT